MKPKATKRSADSDNENSQTQNRSRQRRRRTFFTDEQLDRLEEVFQQERFPGITTREELTEELGIKEDRIQVWFQNRRARWRKREKNKPAPASSKSKPVTTTWPDADPAVSSSTHPYSMTGLASLLPFPTWPYPEDQSAPPAFPFINPLTYRALQFPLPQVLTSSETSSLRSSPSNPSPSEPEPTLVKSCEYESALKDCKFSDGPRSCEALPPSYLGRKNHSSEEYDAAIGLLSVFGRQD